MANSTNRPSGPIVGFRRRPFAASTAPVTTASNPTAEVRDLTNEPVVIRRVPRAWFEPLEVRPLVEFGQPGEIRGVAHLGGEGMAMVRRRPFSDLACPLLTDASTTPVIDIRLQGIEDLIRLRPPRTPDAMRTVAFEESSSASAVVLGWMPLYPVLPTRRLHRITDVAMRTVAFEESSAPSFTFQPDPTMPAIIHRQWRALQTSAVAVGFEGTSSPGLNLSYKFVGPDTITRGLSQRHLYPSVTLQTIPPAVLPAPTGWDPFYPERVFRQPTLRQDGNVTLNFVAPPPELASECQYPDMVRGVQPLVPEGLAVRTFGPIDFAVPDGSWTPTYPNQVPGMPPRGFTGKWEWLDPSPTLIVAVGNVIKRLLLKVGL